MTAKKEKGRKFPRLTITATPLDVVYLKELAVEKFVLAGGVADWFLRGEQPNVSGVIRDLLEENRERRAIDGWHWVIGTDGLGNKTVAWHEHTPGGGGEVVREPFEGEVPPKLPEHLQRIFRQRLMAAPSPYSSFEEDEEGERPKRKAARQKASAKKRTTKKSTVRKPR